MSDIRDPLLQDAVSRYNLPPPTPREEIWAGIRRARGRDRTVTVPAHRMRWYTGLAAAVLVALAIGRLSLAPPLEPEPVALRAPVVAHPPSDATGGQMPDAKVAARPTPTVEGVESGGASRTIPNEIPDAGTPARQPAGSPADAPPAAEARPRHTSDLAARRAMSEYVNRAEVFLTLIRVDARAGRVDARAAADARELLTTTRLLLDSEAGEQLEMRELLGDLELVLIQIAQLPSSATAAELEWVVEGIEQHNMLPRLRIAAPVDILVATL